MIKRVQPRCCCLAACSPAQYRLPCDPRAPSEWHRARRLDGSSAASSVRNLSIDVSMVRRSSHQLYKDIRRSKYCENLCAQQPNGARFPSSPALNFRTSLSSPPCLAATKCWSVSQHSIRLRANCTVTRAASEQHGEPPAAAAIAPFRYGELR